MTIALVLYITCVALGIITGLYLGVNMWFDLKVALPTSVDYDREGRLAKEWRGGRLAALIRRRVYLRCFLFALMFILLWIFVNLPGAFCFLVGLTVIIMAQGGRFDRYDRDCGRQYMKKYAKYLGK